MRPRKSLVLTALSLSAVLATVQHASPSAAVGKPVLLIYGDSLTVQSANTVHYFYDGQYDVVFRAYGGTAACDWSPLAAGDRNTYHPSRVVIAFTGNTSSCATGTYGVPGFIQSYRAAVQQFHTAFNGIPIKLVGSPAMNDQDPNRPHSNGIPELNALYKDLSAGGANALSNTVYNASADNSLTPNHVFRWSGPQFPGNGPIVTLRVSDGMHLTADGQTYYGIALGG